MFGIGSKHDAVYGVLIDIGSGSVGVGIVESSAHSPLPHILFSHRVYMHVSKNAATKGDHMRQLREALFSASLILSKDGIQALREHNKKGRIEKIFVTCSSPWAVTIARNVSYDTEEEVRVTESLIHDLVESAEHEIESTMGQTSLVGSLGLEIVERTTVDIRINDYSVATPFGLKGKEVDLTHITGLVPKDILEAVYEVQDKIFREASVHAHTFMLVMYCVLRDVFPNEQALTIVNVTAEGTEFGIIEQGTLIETVYAPMGANTLIRAIAQETQKIPADIVSLLRAYAVGELSEKAKTEVSGYLDKYREVISKTVHDIAGYRTVPATLTVTAQPQYQDVFTLLMTEMSQKEISANAKILTLPHDLLDEIASHATTPDVFITIAGRFFHKLHGCGEMDMD